jgi:hypothetical protein
LASAWIAAAIAATSTFFTQRTSIMKQTKPSVTKSPAAPLQAGDSGKIVLGAGMRLPTARAHVADPGKIVLGAGMRLPAER